MTSREDLARSAAKRALVIRQKCDLRPWQPADVYEVAKARGVDIWFADLPSVEGMYCRGKSAAVISSLRPPGRQAATAAHELGHHEFGHGDTIEELVDERGQRRTFSPDEFLADCFASTLLLPKTAVERGFSTRGWPIPRCTAEQAFVVATWLGVGFTTLVRALQLSHRSLTPARAADLLTERPLDIRTRLLGRPCLEGLVVADVAWTDRAIDLAVGDYLLLPRGAVAEGASVSVVDNCHARGVLVQGSAPGIGRVAQGTWAAYVRVARRKFVGRAIYRFEEEVPDGE